MAKLVWTPAALSDLRRLHRFLVSKNPDAARRAIRRIREGVRFLARLPEAGRPVEELPLGFRQRTISFGNSGYIVLYRYDGDLVVLLAVRHAREAGYLEANEEP